MGNNILWEQHTGTPATLLAYSAEKQVGFDSQILLVDDMSRYRMKPVIQRATPQPPPFSHIKGVENSS